MSSVIRALPMVVLCAVAIGCGEGAVGPVDDPIDWVSAGGPLGGQVTGAAAAKGALVAAVPGSGLWRSVDSGATWARVNLGRPEDIWQGIHATPTGALIASGQRLYRSTDGGSTWQEGQRFGLRAFTSLPDGTVYGSDLGAVYRSSNDGVTWDTAGAVPGTLVVGLAGLSDGRLLAGTSARGVWVSANGGATWVQTGLSSSFYNAVLEAADGSWIAGSLGGAGSGLERSTDDGVSWTSVAPGFLGGDAFIQSIVLVDGVIYAGGASPLLRSSDNGATWTQTPADVPSQILALDSATDGALWVSTTGGLRRWNPAGAAPAALVGFPVATVLAAVDLANGDILAGGVAPDITGDGVLQSRNAATGRWATETPFGATPLAATRAGGALLVGFGETGETSLGGILRSTDEGASYEVVLEGGGGASDFAILNAATIFAAVPRSQPGRKAAGVYASADGGRTWSLASTDLSGQPIASLAVDDAGSLYAGAIDPSPGVWRSIDQGATWTEIAGAAAGAPVFALLATDDGDLLVGTVGGGLRRINANGQASGAGLGSDTVLSLARDAAGTVYAATGSALWRRLSGDDRWEDATGDLPEPVYVTLFSSGRIAVGTQRSGLWLERN